MKSILYSLPILMITACTDYSNAFDCPPKPGLGCRSISEIHNTIEEHPKGKDALNLSEDTQCVSGKCLKSEETRRLPDLVPTEGYLVVAGSDHVRRIPESVIRIWVTGRMNDAGDYVAPHYIYVALKNEGWQQLKRKEKINDDD